MVGGRSRQPVTLVMGICFALFATLIAALFVGIHVRFAEIRMDDDKICAWRLVCLGNAFDGRL
jgi:hypothetical protein